MTVNCTLKKMNYVFRKNVNSAVCNQGIFREVLRLMTQSGDGRLKRHLMTSSARATYVGKNTQNGLINCIGDEILESILQKVRSAEYFAIMFDETTDISHKSQLSLVIRYVTSAGQVHESFVGFIDTFDDILETEKKQNEAEQDDEQEEERREPATETKLTGEAIGLIVIRMLQKLRLNLDKCIGIATDNCSVMVSELKGAVQEIQKYARNALRTPCFSHKLNLSLSKSNQVISIRNAIGTMKSCVTFFDDSPKRNTVLKTKLGHQLSGLCETRWIERHDGVLQYTVDLSKVIECLDEISEWADTSSSSMAVQLRAALTDPFFLVAV
ncbi:52 kDa repressor of the inhibitor of the protein kinase-like [Homalodisca vitripennis]|uniref:52 kDa repressor of the inhibitor of the protein kinase-like n=1 Tax=Homalodisca vitripennis TaxID=197043 RepID=UPI001EEBA291|nr:52 kDa repressor of the inhibitor of the protein kinase-like [Homalodisca vitripennis]